MRQQLSAAVPLVERLLLGLREAAPELGGRIMSELVDDDDCVGTYAWGAQIVNNAQRLG